MCPIRQCAEHHFGGEVKLDRGSCRYCHCGLAAAASEKFLRARDPVWRENLAVRVGLPVSEQS